MRGRCSMPPARPLAGGDLTTDLFQVERIREMENCPLFPVGPMQPPYRRNAMIGDRKPETKYADRQDIDPDFTIARLGECRSTARNIVPATPGSPKAFAGPGLSLS